MCRGRQVTQPFAARKMPGTTNGQRLIGVKTWLLPAKTHKNCAKNTKFFCPLLDISLSGSPIIQDGERCDRRRWRMKGAERVAAVDKIEDQHKPEDFIGHRNRKTGWRRDPRSRQRPNNGLRHFHRKHAGRGIKTEQT